MNFVSKLTGWLNQRGGRGDLKANMEKALAMKREAGPQTNIPEHQTSRKGEVRDAQVTYTDTGVGPEPTGTPNLKRSRVARSGDT